MNPGLTNKPLEPDDITGHIFDQLFSKTIINEHANLLPADAHQQVIAQNIEPVALACNTTYQQAENIRQQLGRNSIVAICFQRDVFNKNSIEYASRRPATAHLFKPHYEAPIVLLLLNTAAFLGVMFSILNGFKSLESAFAVFTAAAFLFIFLQIKILTIPNSTSLFGLNKHPELAKLYFSEFYLLDFDPDKSRQSTPRTEFVDEKHAEIYHNLRSSRVRASYERIVLTLLNAATKHGSVKQQFQQILSDATDIARRVTDIENRLINQSQSMLFEQLTRLDTLLAHTRDTDQTAELIQQKTDLRTQLDQIDADRQELKKLGQELTKVAEELHF